MTIDKSQEKKCHHFHWNMGYFIFWNINFCDLILYPIPCIQFVNIYRFQFDCSPFYNFYEKSLEQQRSELIGLNLEKEYLKICSLWKGFCKFAYYSFNCNYYCVMTEWCDRGDFKIFKTTPALAKKTKINSHFLCKEFEFLGITEGSKKKVNFQWKWAKTANGRRERARTREQMKICAIWIITHSRTCINNSKPIKWAVHTGDMVAYQIY